MITRIKLKYDSSIISFLVDRHTSANCKPPEKKRHFFQEFLRVSSKTLTFDELYTLSNALCEFWVCFVREFTRKGE